MSVSRARGASRFGERNTKHQIPNTRAKRAMRVILNPKHADHAPPGEWDGGAVIPSYEAPGRFDAIRAALEVAGGFTFEEPKPSEEVLTGVHDAAYVAYLRDSSAEAKKVRSPGAKELWPTVFPFGPNPRATGPRA